jgi:hypothetical protein
MLHSSDIDEAPLLPGFVVDSLADCPNPGGAQGTQQQEQMKS